MQKSVFPDGGFVVHRIMGLAPSGARVSAWFTKDGAPIDAEIITLGRNLPVRRNGPMWRALEDMGRRWA
jgi:hypothetical protein